MSISNLLDRFGKADDRVYSVSGLPKILYQHDVTVVTFRQCPQERTPIGEECQPRMTVLGRSPFETGQPNDPLVSKTDEVDIQETTFASDEVDSFLPDCQQRGSSVHS